MPELIEIEYYRRAFDPLIGGRIDAVEMPDDRFGRPKGTPPELFEQIVGERLTSTRRLGKLLLLHFGSALHLGSASQPDDELVLGLRFGMTGRLLIDGSGPIDKLEYASGRDEPQWDRFTLTISGQRVSIRDQRRLGSVELDPDLDALGPEASTLSADALRTALSGRTKAIKAVLLDQKLVAGLGNLLVDESLWRAAIAPTRAAHHLDSPEVDSLAATIRETVAELTDRGGSHTGDSFDARGTDAPCPADGAPMHHDTVGGRSTWWCPTHQR